MTDILTPKVLVIGGGPGGYVAAIRCGQLGLDTLLVETDRLGGTCLIRGCIPSKALIHAAGLYEEMAATHKKSRFGISLGSAPLLDFGQTVDWKESVVDRLSGGVAGLLRKAKVTSVAGWARFSDAKTCTVDTAEGPIKIQAEHVILATGARPVEIPNLPFGGIVISSTEALSLPELPKQLVVVGAGYIGLELGIAFAKMGTEVSIVEMREQILPLYDEKLVAPVRAWLDQHGVSLHLGAKALGATGEALEIETDAGERLLLPADRILVTVGRRPHTKGWGIEDMALAMDGPFVKVDDRCATSTTNVWAIGDLVGEPMLAHKASAQGEMVAEIIAGHRRRFDPIAIAAVCFTEPEIVAVGLLPSEAGEGAITGQFPFQANGRALSMDAGDAGGFVRVVARADNHRILGIQAVGQHVSELAGEFATLMEMGAVLQDVAGVIHVHPTLGEAVHESALKALGHALHI